MAVKLGINGFGRIGRYLTRLLDGDSELDVAVINTRSDNASLAHLLKYDSVHRAFPGGVSAEDGHLLINGKKVRSLEERDPSKLPWKDLEIDVVLECTGAFRKREALEAQGVEIEMEVTWPSGASASGTRPWPRTSRTERCESLSTRALTTGMPPTRGNRPPTFSITAKPKSSLSRPKVSMKSERVFISYSAQGDGRDITLHQHLQGRQKNHIPERRKGKQAKCQAEDCQDDHAS